MQKSPAHYRTAALAVYLVMFLQGCSTIMVPANKEALMAHFGIGIGEISTLIAIRGLVSGVLPAVFGGLSDKLGRKKILLCGLALFSLYYLALPFLPAYAPLVLFAVLLGCAHSLTDPSCQAILFDVYGDPSTKMPLIQVTYSAGAILMPLLVGFLLFQGLTWKLSFWLVFAVAAALFLFAAGLNYPPKLHRPAPPAEEGQAAIRRPKVLREGLCLFLFVVLNLVFVTMVSNWVDLYMKEVFAYPEAAAVMVLGYYQAGCIAGALLFVVLLRRVHTTQIFVYFSLAALLLFLLCLWAPNPGLFTVLLVLLAVCAGAFFSLTISYGGNLFHTHAGAASGALSSASSLGVAAASLLAGQLIPKLGVRGLFGWLPLVGVLCLLLAVLMRRQYKKLNGVP